MRAFLSNFAVVTLCFIGLFAVTSCEEESSQKETRLTVSTTGLSFTGIGGSQTLTVDANTNWTITEIPEWLAVTPTSSSNEGIKGGLTSIGSGSTSHYAREVTITAAENTMMETRVCEIVVSTNNGEISHQVTISQSGVSPTLLVDVNQVTLAPSGENSGSFKITSNTSWTITGEESWFYLSATEGQGNATIKVTPKSANISSYIREATLKVSVGGTVVNVLVRQAGILEYDCNVHSRLTVALSDGIGADFTPDTNVSYYYVELWGSTITTKTDAEVIAAMDLTESERLPANEAYTTAWTNLSPNTDYWLVTLGFNSSGKHGDLIREKITTKSANNLPLAEIDSESVRFSESYWYWTVNSNAYAANYLMWKMTSTGSLNEDDSDAMIAWFFYDSTRRTPSQFPYNSGSKEWTAIRNGETALHLATWALDSQENYSGAICRYHGYIDGVTSAPGVRQVKQRSVKTADGRRSIQRIR